MFKVGQLVTVNIPAEGLVYYRSLKTAITTKNVTKLAIGYLEIFHYREGNHYDIRLH